MKKTRIDSSTRSGGNTATRLRAFRDRLLLQEDLNFLLTNRLPRSLMTHAMGRFSSIRNPLLTRASIAVWQFFTDLDLSESKHRRFHSLQECFTRELKPGMRPVNSDSKILVSPCDGIIGAWGSVRGMQAFQAKGFPYSIEDLFGSAGAAADFQNGSFITLRLTSDMYHRFHSPESGTVEKVTSISGDTWNVNPIALRRVENLFCKNERAVVRLRLADGRPVAMVAVAAILVASIRLHFLNLLLSQGWKGPREIPCSTPVVRGEELGWFEHGSTIILFAPAGFKVCAHLQSGHRVRMGEALIEIPPFSATCHTPLT